MAKTTKFAFGKAFERLSDIVEALESGEVELDEALKQYEEGLKLVQDCKKKLKDVGNKIEVIKDKYEDSAE